VGLLVQSGLGTSEEERENQMEERESPWRRRRDGERRRESMSDGGERK
jgi:hypothetical protein